MGRAIESAIDLRQLRGFEALARLGGFTAAAKELFVTQSAVSHSIKALEETLDCQLIERQGRKIDLTDQGRALLLRTRRILEELRVGVGEVGDLHYWGRGRIRVGVTASMGTGLLPAVLREFRESFPDADIEVETGNTLELLDKLQSGAVNMALGLRLDHIKTGTYRPLFKDSLHFVYSAIHPWAQQASLSPQDFFDVRFIVYGQHTQTFKIVEHWFGELHLRASTAMRVGSMEAIKELAKVGVGVGILAPWVARREIEIGQLQVREIPGSEMSREWVAYLPTNRRLSLAEETFLGISEIVGRELQRSCSIQEMSVPVK
ncbi:MAG: DNA-binding transcriptional LysR family regulator [Verrucomicrobiales bacterium]|jgi:DNA-binding transcriptional LysR family regulator